MLSMAEHEKKIEYVSSTFKKMTNFSLFPNDMMAYLTQETQLKVVKINEKFLLISWINIYSKKLIVFPHISKAQLEMEIEKQSLC